MKTIKTIKQMHAEAARLKSKNKTIGFVPTMGCLHEGHASLLKQSKKENDVTVLSIYVNPKQFGPAEDFSRYPRDLKKDKMLAKKENVDIMFFPSDDEMYPKRYLTYVEVEKMPEGLCGQFRPGHFRGVATIVAKLLNIVSPDILYLGQKDAQQAVILSKMAEDLNIPVKVKIMPTVREADGLAMSSRNVYLSREDRHAAVNIFRALAQAEQAIKQGERDAAAIIYSIEQIIEAAHPTKVDYIECVSAGTLEPLTRFKGNVLIAVAAWFGQTRLIDNIRVKVK